MIGGRAGLLVLASICAAVMAAAAAAATSKPMVPQKVDVEHAKDLAVLGLADHARYEAPWADEWLPPDRWILVSFRYQGSIGSRNLAVNSSTGDVWDRDKCVFATTPALQAAVAEIRRSFSPTEFKQYERLHRMTGDCLPEEQRKMAIAVAGEEAQKRASAVKQNRTLAGDLPKRVDADHARLLLTMAVSATAEPELGEAGTDLKPMMVFSAQAADGAKGIYEINPWTGGVWDVEKCVWLSTPALIAAQDEIRQGFSTDELGEYGKAQGLRMDCDSERRRWWARTDEIVKTLRKRVANERRARALVVLAEPGATVASLDYEHGPDGDHFFYQFQGLGPRGGSFGYFAVNPWTGDVWNEWNCAFPTTPAFRRAQAKIRQSYAPAELWKYQRLHLTEAECMTD